MLFAFPALLLAPLVVILAYIVLAVGGFGSGLLSIPLLALLLPVKLVIPVVLVVDFVATLSTGLRFWRDVAFDEIKPLVPTMLLGLFGGVALLVWLPARLVLLALGLFILGYGAYSLFHHARPRTCSKVWSIPAGLLGGVISGMFGMGGPIYVIYLTRRIVDPLRLRVSFSVVFSINAAARLLLFLFSGLLMQQDVWIGVACLLPFMVLGLAIGHHIHLKLTAAQVARLVSLLLVATGVSVLWKALASG